MENAENRRPLLVSSVQIMFTCNKSHKKASSHGKLDTGVVVGYRWSLECGCGQKIDIIYIHVPLCVFE